MKFKEVATSNASTEAKVAALALLLDKELIKLADTVLNVKKLEGPKGEQGIQGPKGEQGDRGFDGTNGKDGADGKDGKDGEDGKQGVGVADAKIDFDGSLVITLTDGTEINAGDVVPLDTAEKIRVIGNGGGTSQSVLDAIDAINAIISTYGTMATQNANNVAITGGSINGTTIGGTTPAAGTFTTLTATGQTDLGGASSNPVLRVNALSSAIQYIDVFGSTTGTTLIRSWSTNGSGSGLNFQTRGASGYSFQTGGTTLEQLRVTHTASAVNYVQVTGAATTGIPVISSQGSDTNIGLTSTSKGTGSLIFRTNNNAQTQFTITHTGSAVNYWQATGAAAGSSPVLSVVGSDTNVSMAFQSKGTGAIDLAAGSRGVNISNGGTVTALTMTNNGTTAYTSHPTPAITAPTTAGGVQATASSNLYYLSTIATTTIVSGGTGYTVGDTLTVSGGTFTTAATFTVSTVATGVVTAIAPVGGGTYSAIPTGTLSVTGGTGTGFTFTINGWAVRSLNITNAGSGYVEQPTVSFSGGGGSGAAAYATVGGTTIIRSLGTNLDFYTPNNTSTPSFRIYDSQSAGTGNYIQIRGASGTPLLWSTAGINISSGGTSAISLYTNANSQEQLRVAHTASAVNYVQVTGAATTGWPVISMQGSDANIGTVFRGKGSGAFEVQGGGNGTLFNISGTSGTSRNFLNVASAAAGSSPVLSTAGSDTNIDLALTPKGTGNVKFGTYTATMALTIQGYIEIKDSGGTVRKLAVIA